MSVWRTLYVVQSSTFSNVESNQIVNNSHFETRNGFNFFVLMNDFNLLMVKWAYQYNKSLRTVCYTIYFTAKTNNKHIHIGSKIGNKSPTKSSNAYIIVNRFWFKIRNVLNKVINNFLWCHIKYLLIADRHLVTSLIYWCFKFVFFFLSQT